MHYQNGTLGPPDVLLDGIPNAVTHHGGRLMFRGGLLYATTGDAGVG